MTDTDKHPMQPVVLDERGIARFKENKIVRFLLDAEPYDMNKLAMMPFNKDDRQQFAQLIGYSIDGYWELESYHDKDVAVAADALAKQLKA